MTRATIIVPVKPWRLSKSRLETTAGAREGLARAFALDVLAAVARSARVEQVVVVTAEPELNVVARRLGAIVVRDRPMLSPDGLIDAVAQGIRWSAAERPDAPVLVVPADLPAMTDRVLDAAIDLMSRADTAFVPDASGHGTTLYWASVPGHLEVGYGAGSAFRHLKLGARAVPEVDARARRDVDTTADLVVARELGVGFHTAAMLDSLQGRTSAPRGA